MNKPSDCRPITTGISAQHKRSLKVLQFQNCHLGCWKWMTRLSGWTLFLSFLTAHEKISIFRGPEKSLKTDLVFESFEIYQRALKSAWIPKCLIIPVMWKMVQSLENYVPYSEHQCYLLTWCRKIRVISWKLWWNTFGKKVVRCFKVLEKLWILFLPKHCGLCSGVDDQGPRFQKFLRKS